MHMVDAPDGRIRAHAHLVEGLVESVEPRPPHRFEAGRELRKRVDCGARARELLVVERDRTVRVPHRDDRPVEAALGHRLRSALLAQDGQLVAVLAAEALHRCDEICRDPLRNRRILRAQRRVVTVERRWCAGLVDRPSRHRLDSDAHDQILHPGEDAHRGQRHRLLAGAAEPVQREARRRVRPSGGEHGQAADALTVITDAVAVADDHVLGRHRLDAGSVGERVEALRQQLLRMDVVQRTVRLALPPRRADAVDDPGFECLRHRQYPLRPMVRAIAFRWIWLVPPEIGATIDSR